ncbi:MAG: hypothetical protein Q8N99_02615 [Nanoarchaeota archaeon]|nr:hypothetical protein [Nanoarchaeota archaeon]
MVTYGILLEPDKIISSKIKGLKIIIKSLIGNQLYLDDEPHLSIYHADFLDISEWDKELEDLIYKIKKDTNKIQIAISDWIIFKEKNINKITLACNIIEENVDMIRRIQKQVIDHLQSFRNPIIIKRYKDSYESLGDIERKNTIKYGFPYIGNIFKPHISLATIDNNKFEILFNKIKDLCPKGNYNIISLNVYLVDDKDDSLKLIKKYPLI